LLLLVVGSMMGGCDFAKRELTMVNLRGVRENCLYIPDANLIDAEGTSGNMTITHNRESAVGLSCSLSSRLDGSDLVTVESLGGSEDDSIQCAVSGGSIDCGVGEVENPEVVDFGRQVVAELREELSRTLSVVQSGRAGGWEM